MYNIGSYTANVPQNDVAVSLGVYIYTYVCVYIYTYTSVSGYLYASSAFMAHIYIYTHKAVGIIGSLLGQVLTQHAWTGGSAEVSFVLGRT